MNLAVGTISQPAPGAELTRRTTIHDLRNLFAVVGAATSLLRRDAKPAQRSAALKALEEAALRGSQLATELLTSRARPQRAGTIEMSAALARIEPMLSALAGTRVELSLEIEGESLPVRLAPAELEAALVELVVNARSARAGAIVIRAGRRGEQVWLLVADDGCGMTAQHLAQGRRGVDQQRAHGAGLSRVRQVVTSNDGRLRIRSRSGRGTTIALIFPAAA